MSKWKEYPVIEIKTDQERRQIAAGYVTVEGMMRYGLSRTAAYRIMQQYCRCKVIDPKRPRPLLVMSRIDLARLRVSRLKAPPQRGNPSFRDREAQRERAQRRWNGKKDDHIHR